MSVTQAGTATGPVVSFGSFTADVYNQLAGIIPELNSFSANGSADALPNHVTGTIRITTAGVNAMTLAAPGLGSLKDGGDAGRTLIIISETANAHTLTATGLLKTGSASVNVATFAAFAGASLTLRASGGLWYVIASNAVTFS
jgi:hypothetical protein